MTKLRIVAFSDYRIQDIDLLIIFIRKMQEKPDIVLYAGDDIERFVEHEQIRSTEHPGMIKRGKIIRNRFEEIASLSKLGLCAVIGNDDSQRVREFIHGKNVHSVQKKPFIFQNYAVIGIEGAIDDPKDDSIGIGYTLYSEDSLKKYLENIKKKIKNKKIIILSHSPPRNSLDLAIRFGMRNIGSKSLRDFIKKNHRDIPLVVCGHVHLQGGKNTAIEKTIIVNAASHDNIGEPGRVAILDVNDDDIEINWHELYGVDGICGIGPKSYQKLKEMEIITIEQLVDMNVIELSHCLTWNQNRTSKIQVQAKAVFEKKIILLKRMILIDENAVFFDIETDLEQKLVWMIGIYFAKSHKLVQLVAHNRSQEKSILKKFMETMKDFRGKIYTYSGTRFDERVIKNRLDSYKMNYSNLPEFIDLSTFIKRSYALPLKSYSLKSIANYFGYKYKHPNLNGMTVALEYLSNYQKTKDEKLMKKLLEYNKDDLFSLLWIMEKLSLVA